MGMKPRRWRQRFNRYSRNPEPPARRWFWVTRSPPGYNIWPGPEIPYRVVNGAVLQEWWQVDCHSVPYIYPDRWAMFAGGLRIPRDRPVRVEFSARIFDGR